METLEKDTIAAPVVNSWRRKPSVGQIRYATDLCRSELPYAERTATVATFTVLDSKEMSELIDELKAVRAKRLDRLRAKRRPRRRAR
jgi:hypothetical protein